MVQSRCVTRNTTSGVSQSPGFRLTYFSFCDRFANSLGEQLSIIASTVTFIDWDICLNHHYKHLPSTMRLSVLGPRNQKKEDDDALVEGPRVNTKHSSKQSKKTSKLSSSSGNRTPSKTRSKSKDPENRRPRSSRSRSCSRYDTDRENNDEQKRGRSRSKSKSNTKGRHSSRSRSRGKNQSRSRSRSKSHTRENIVKERGSTDKKAPPGRRSSKPSSKHDNKKVKSAAKDKNRSKSKSVKRKTTNSRKVIDKVPTVKSYDSNDSIEHLLEERSKYSRYSIETEQDWAVSGVLSGDELELDDKYNRSIAGSRITTPHSEFMAYPVERLLSDSTDEGVAQWRGSIDEEQRDDNDRICASPQASASRSFDFKNVEKTDDRTTARIEHDDEKARRKEMHLSQSMLKKDDEGSTASSLSEIMSKPLKVDKQNPSKSSKISKCDGSSSRVLTGTSIFKMLAFGRKRNVDSGPSISMETSFESTTPANGNKKELVQLKDVTADKVEVVSLMQLPIETHYDSDHGEQEMSIMGIQTKSPRSTKPKTKSISVQTSPVRSNKEPSASRDSDASHKSRRSNRDEKKRVSPSGCSQSTPPRTKSFSKSPKGGNSVDAIEANRSEASASARSTKNPASFRSRIFGRKRSQAKTSTRSATSPSRRQRQSTRPKLQALELRRPSTPTELDEYSVSIDVSQLESAPLVHCLRFYSCDAAAGVADTFFKITDCNSNFAKKDAIDYDSSDLVVNDAKYLIEDEINAPKTKEIIHAYKNRLECKKRSKFTKTKVRDLYRPASPPSPPLVEAPELSLAATPSIVREVTGLRLQLDDSLDAERSSHFRIQPTSTADSALSVTSISFLNSGRSSLYSSDEDEDDDGSYDSDGILSHRKKHGVLKRLNNKLFRNRSQHYHD